MDDMTNNITPEFPHETQNQQIPQYTQACPAPQATTGALPPKPIYTRADAAFAWLCFALGFLFARYVTQFAGGLWGGIFWACFGTLGAVCTRVKRLKTSAAQKAVFAVAETFCLVPLFCTNGFINVLAAWFSFLLMFYLCITISGAELFGKHFVSDLLMSVFVRPFKSFGCAPAAGFSPIKGKAPLKTFGYVLIGLVIAVPLTVVAVILLILSDGFFEDVMSGFFHSLPALSFSLIWQIIFGALIGMFLFGAIYSAAKPVPGYDPAAPCCRILPPVIAYTAVTPVCVFYLVYVITQFVGLQNALSNPSEYARRGFFELCFIAVINLVVISLIQLFTARLNNDRKPSALKFYTTMISGFTLLFIASAFSRMALYIGQYGLTPLRVYTSWFMGLLAVVFVVIIISQFAEIPMWRVLFVGFTLMFGVLCFGNIDGQIARYNVGFAQSGGELDLSAMRELNGMACKPLVELLESGDTLPEGVSARQIEVFLAAELQDMQQQDGFAYFSIPRQTAIEAVSRAGVNG